jgi:hypothetical protein
MKKLFFLSIILPFFSNGYSQTKFRNHVPKIEGIWIEQNFKKDFDSIPSMAQFSKNINRKNYKIATYPIGLRIQQKEEKDGILNVGFGVLHGHLFYPETSKYCIQNNDTIYEQGSFTIKLHQLDSLGFYEVQDLWDDYAISSKCFIKINYKDDTSITILRKATAQIPQITLNYTKITSSFSKEYPYPNPRDYFLRQKTLTGNYSLKDSLGKKVSSNFAINNNGSIDGYKQWKNQKIEFVADVFCGGPASFDKVLIYDPNNIRQANSKLFIYKRIDENTIQLFTINAVKSGSLAGKPAFILSKK